MPTDWTNLDSLVSPHFTVRELTYLPSWQVCHIPTESEKNNLTALANKMEELRSFLALPINVHCAIRPILNNVNSGRNGQDYNTFVGGAPKSAHIVGLALDWDCGQDCDETRYVLNPQLENFNIRMENNPKSNWVHIDLMPPNPNRFFIP